MLVLSGMAGCGTVQVESDTAAPVEKKEGGSFGFGLFNRGNANTRIANVEDELGVNAHIWQAALDALSFMPLTSADPVGGIVITDWYQSRSAPKERFKVTVYILDKNLRADGVRVSAFKQELTDNGWQDAAMTPDTSIKLENAILSRARELHIQALDTGN